jgi:ribosomal 30S subunit maturation factor RimM
MMKTERSTMRDIAMGHILDRSDLQGHIRVNRDSEGNISVIDDGIILVEDETCAFRLPSVDIWPYTSES